MCEVKTENQAVNMSRLEGDFWRDQTRKIGARSRGDLQKMLLLLGLAQVDAKAAKELQSIRERYHRLGNVAAALLLGIFTLTLFQHDVLRSPARCRRGQESYLVELENPW